MRTPARASAETARSKAEATGISRSSSITVFGMPRRRPSGGMAAGTSQGSLAMIASVSAQHATLTPIGPIESRVVESGTAPSRGTRYWVGLNPTRPHSAAGIRTEPPVSVPIATAAMPSATETGAPAEEPPGIRLRSWGLPGVP